MYKESLEEFSLHFLIIKMVDFIGAWQFFKAIIYFFGFLRLLLKFRINILP